MAPALPPIGGARLPPIEAAVSDPPPKREAKFAPGVPSPIPRAAVPVEAEPDRSSTGLVYATDDDGNVLYAPEETVPPAFKCCVIFLVYLWCSLMLAAVGVPFAMYRQRGFDAPSPSSPSSPRCATASPLSARRCSSTRSARRRSSTVGGNRGAMATKPRSASRAGRAGSKTVARRQRRPCAVARGPR